MDNLALFTSGIWSEASTTDSGQEVVMPLMVEIATEQIDVALELVGEAG